MAGQAQSGHAGGAQQFRPGPAESCCLRRTFVPKWIPTEKLVRPLSHLADDDSVIPRQLENEIDRNANRIGYRFVLQFDHARQEVEQSCWRNTTS